MVNIPCFSIIIPHHNTPNLLRRLISSIPQRDDVEVIIIDDNSDPSICDFDNFPGLGLENYSVFFDKKGGGGGYARNLGLSMAKGKWILFADADDFFFYSINEVFDKYKQNTADVIFLNATCLDSENYLPLARTAHLNAHLPIKSKNDEVFLRYKFGEPWCKLVKKDLLNKFDIHFEETTIHNDTWFSFLIGKYASSIVGDAKCVYCVTSRKNSVSRTLSESKKIERVRVFSRLLKEYKKLKLDIKPIMNYPYRQLAHSFVEQKDTFNEEIKIMHDEGFSKIEVYFHMLPDLLKVIVKRIVK